MEWLSQNWIWIAFAIGGFFLLNRMGIGGCGMGRMGVGGSTGDSHGSGRDGSSAERGADSGTAFDPVSRHALPADGAISAVYQGRAYYFESRENRDAFESDAEKYIAVAPVAGQAIGAKAASSDQPRQRHGCC